MNTEMSIKCEYTDLVDIHKLVPHPKNMNDHPPEQIKRLSEIIDYQGMRSPIVVSKLSGFITKGHGRLDALKALNWEKAPVDYQDYENEAQEYADIVADNAIAEWATLDLAKINMDLSDFGPELDIEMLGLKSFTIEPMDKYIEEVNQGDESSEWAQIEGDFQPGENYINLSIHFKTELQREVFCKDHEIIVKTRGARTWVAHQ